MKENDPILKSYEELKSIRNTPKKSFIKKEAFQIFQNSTPARKYRGSQIFHNSLFINEKIDKNRISSIVSRKLSINENELNFLNTNIDFKLHEELIDKAIEIFRRGATTFKEKQISISFLNQLEPFNQILAESTKEEIEIILQNLSDNLKYERVLKNRIILKYEDNIDKFHLILQGKVNILVPNEEDIDLTEEEYFYYLLRLRLFNEMGNLKKVLSKNFMTFPMEEKNFDEWVKTAYNTLKLVKGNFKIKFEMTKTTQGHYVDSPYKKQSSNSFAKKFNLGVPVYKNTKRSSALIIQGVNGLERKNVFNTIEKKNMVVKFEKEIILAMKLIEPHNIDLINVDISQIISKNVSTENYINRIKPIKFNYKLQSLRKPTKVITYFVVNTLNTGDKFGDMMSEINFSNELSDNVSTIITCENCDFGILNKEGYKKCLKDVSEKMRKKKVNFLLGIEIFKFCNKNKFKQKFSTCFRKRVINNHEILFHEGEESSTNRMIYFIRSGEFLCHCKKNIYEINEIYENLGYSFLINESDEDDILDKEADVYIKFKKKKHNIKIEYIKENDVIGLDDSIYNNKYIYTFECISPNATVYEIHYNFFKLILNSDPKIVEEVRKYENIHRNILMKLLLKIRENKSQYFKLVEKTGNELNFGPIKFKKFDVNNQLQKLLDLRNRTKNGNIIHKSVHKKKLKVAINSFRNNFNNNNNYQINYLTLNSPNENNKNILSIDNYESKKSKVIVPNLKFNTTESDFNSNNPHIHTLTATTFKEKSNSFSLSKILRQEKSEPKNYFYEDEKTSDRNKKTILSEKKTRNKKFDFSMRKDQTLLPLMDKTQLHIYNAKKITQSIKGLFDDYKNKKDTVFNMLKKSIYNKKL